MIRRLVILGSAGALAAGAAWLAPLSHADGACGATAYTPSATATTVALPDGGTVYADGDASTASGHVGITGPHGYLDAGGSSSGGTVQGYNPDSGLNGVVNVPPSSASDICVSPS